MRILVTNDDGVFAPGITTLALALSEAGHEVTVVAPFEDESGSSAATGVRPQGTADALALEAVELERATGVRAFGIAAYPAACVAIALSGALNDPAELVISGVNKGRNVGRLILHSGTVGAALTAAKLGRSALAVSIKSDGRTEPAYSTAATVAVALVEPLAAMPTATVLNCNVPNLALSELAGVRRARLSESDIFHSATVRSGRVRVSVGYRGRSASDDDDEALTSRGFVTLTVIDPPREDTSPSIVGRLDDEAARLERHLTGMANSQV